MWPALLLSGYSVLIVAASYAGGWLPARFRLSHTRMQAIMSFVAGLMLGVALLHMLPHAAAHRGSVDRTMGATLLGLLVMFFLIRTFHIHHHDAEETADEADPTHAAGHDHGGHAGHGAGCAHHDHVHQGPAAGGAAVATASLPAGIGHRYSWIGLFLGLAVHTLIDGMALGASVAAEADHEHAAGLLGIGTFLAVLLHKPLDALSISSLMLASGWSDSRRNFVNFVFAAMCPAGAAAFWFGASHLLRDSSGVLGLALAFSAGVFLCISLGDLLPEVHFHSHDRLKLSAALLAGVALAYVVGFLEPQGAHEFHSDHPRESQNDHDHGH